AAGPEFCRHYSRARGRGDRVSRRPVSLPPRPRPPLDRTCPTGGAFRRAARQPCLIFPPRGARRVFCLGLRTHRPVDRAHRGARAFQPEHHPRRPQRRRRVNAMHPFTDNPADSVAALGERRLIAAIARWLGDTGPAAPAGIGDDCAVLPRPRHRALVTVDPVIYGEHFDDAVAPSAAGAKLLKRNLSDIAAMGGTPRAAVLALALDRTVRTDWLRAFYRGLAAVARRHAVKIVGGDIAHQKGGLAATLTLFGEAAPGDRVLTRAGARRGDWIYVTGRLGGSLPSRHHWRFTPRLAEGRWLAARPEVRAMMDLSDGLAKDIHALAPAGCTAAVEPDAIPRRRGH